MSITRIEATRKICMSTDTYQLWPRHCNNQAIKLYLVYTTQARQFICVFTFAIKIDIKILLQLNNPLNRLRRGGCIFDITYESVNTIKVWGESRHCPPVFRTPTVIDCEQRVAIIGRIREQRKQHGEAHNDHQRCHETEISSNKHNHNYDDWIHIYKSSAFLQGQIGQKEATVVENQL